MMELGHSTVPVLVQPDLRMRRWTWLGVKADQEISIRLAIPVMDALETRALAGVGLAEEVRET